LRFVPEIGIDLGTANIIVFRRGKGIVLSEPSVVAVNARNGKVLSVGTEARDVVGRTPDNITAIRPLKDGVISDYTTTTKMLQHIIQKTCGNRFPINLKPTLLICVPSGATNVENRAVRNAAREAGAGIAMTIEESFAAAIGAGLPISAPGGNMVVDIGGGTTDIAVISLGGKVISQSLRVGGNKFDEAIARYVRNNHSLMIGEMTAEEIKIRIGSAYPLEEETRMEIRGRDLVGGLPKTIEISSDEVRDALSEPIRQVAEKLCGILEVTPPELSSDIIERGITLTGGGALLRGLDRLLTTVTDIPVRVADGPLNCVAVGTGRALEQLDQLKQSGAVIQI